MDTRERIIEAMLSLLSERPFEEVSLRAIAERAGVGLDELARAFASRGAILEAYTRRVDERVLHDGFADTAEEAPRERLFDVLMTRLDVLRPNRPALACLLRSAERDLRLALFLNALAMRSMRWMLEAAEVTPSGWRGQLALQRLALGFARVLRVFVREDDPGLPRTMAALDKELRAMEKTHQRLARRFGEAVRAAPPNPAAASVGAAGPQSGAASGWAPDIPRGGAPEPQQAAPVPVPAEERSPPPRDEPADEEIPVIDPTPPPDRDTGPAAAPAPRAATFAPAPTRTEAPPGEADEGGTDDRDETGETGRDGDRTNG